jgi:hypothetical protein
MISLPSKSAAACTPPSGFSNSSLAAKADIANPARLAETANTKGATRVTPFALCFGAPVEITLKQRV